MIPKKFKGAMGQARMVFALAMVVGLVLVACAGSSGTITNETDLVAANSLQLEDLDSQGVAAAQDRVLIDIYERALPSVVQIRTTRVVGQSEDSPRSPDIPGMPFDR